MAVFTDSVWVLCLLILSIKSDMKTAKKVISHLINENIFPLRSAHSEKICDIWG